MKELKAKFSTKIDFLNRNEWIPPNKNGWSIKTNQYDKLTAYKEPGFTGNDSYLSGQENIFQIGKKYRVTYSIIGRSQGNFWIKIGNNNSTLRGSNGTFSDVIECDDYGFWLNGSSLFNGGVYDIEIEELTYTGLDISEETSVAINYSVSDIREIGDKRGSYSYTFVLPQTRKNNRFFGNCYDISEDSKFNIKHRVKCLYVEKGNTVLEGFLQLNSINNSDKVYDVTLFGGVLDFFKKISTQNIQELDCSDLDHEYNRVNNNIIWHTGMTYGFYDIGQNIWYWNRFWNYYDNNVYRGIKVNDIYPCVSAKYIFQKIHEDVGVNWRSDLIEASHFADIYMPVNKWEHEEGWKTDKTCNVSGTFDNTPLDPGNEYIYNPLGQGSSVSLRRPANASENWYSAGPGLSDGLMYSPPEGAYVKAKIKIQGTFSNFDSAHPINSINPVKVELRLTDYLRNYKGKNDKIDTFDASFFSTGSFEWEVETDEFYLPALDTSEVGGNNHGMITTLVFVGSSQSCRMQNASWTIKIEEENISDRIAPSSQITNVNELLPDVTQTGFINSLLKQFNLFVTYDQDTNTLHYDTYDSFYSGGTIRRDWEIDYDSPVIVNTLDEQMYEKYIFTHVEGTGLYSKNYLEETEEIYGNYEFDNESDFIEGEYVINSNVYSTPIRYMETQKWNNRLYYSSMSKNQGERNIQHDIGLRFLYKNTGNVGSTSYTGIYYTDEYYNYFYGTHYRSFTHLSDPEALNNYQENEHDLNYGPVEFYDQDMSQGVTNSNLYNKYWKKYIENLSNKDARYLEAYFYLTSNNMVDFKLNDKIEILGTYYYVNKLEYNSNSLSRAELIKSNNFDLDYDAVNSYANNTPAINPNVNQVIGTNNFVDISSVNNQINGDNNKIGPNSYNNVIVGNNNVIGNNVRNCVITNSNDCVVGDYNKETITGATADVSGTTIVTTDFDLEYVSIINSQTITLEPNVNKVNVNLSENVTIYSGVTNVSVDGETQISVRDSNVSVIRGSQVTGGEIQNNASNMIIDCGEDTNQKPFTNAHIIDCGENELSDPTYIDSNTIIEGGENSV